VATENGRVSAKPVWVELANPYLPERDNDQLRRRSLAQHCTERDEHRTSSEHALNHERKADVGVVKPVARVDFLPERGALQSERERQCEHRTTPTPPRDENITRTNMFHRNTKAASMKLYETEE